MYRGIAGCGAAFLPGMVITSGNVSVMTDASGDGRAGLPQTPRANIHHKLFKLYSNYTLNWRGRLARFCTGVDRERHCSAPPIGVVSIA
jgi:hypothetical protein